MKILLIPLISLMLNMILQEYQPRKIIYIGKNTNKNYKLTLGYNGAFKLISNHKKGYDQLSTGTYQILKDSILLDDTKPRSDTNKLPIQLTHGYYRLGIQKFKITTTKTIKYRDNQISNKNKQTVFLRQTKE